MWLCDFANWTELDGIPTEVIAGREFRLELFLISRWRRGAVRGLLATASVKLHPAHHPCLGSSPLGPAHRWHVSPQDSKMLNKRVKASPRSNPSQHITCSLKCQEKFRIAVGRSCQNSCLNILDYKICGYDKHIWQISVPHIKMFKRQTCFFTVVV